MTIRKQNRKLKWIEPGHYPKSERIHLPETETPADPKVRPVKGRKQKNPYHEEPRQKYPARVPNKRVEKEIPKRYIKLKNWVVIDGRRWELVTIAEPTDAKRIVAFAKRAGKEYKVIKVGNVFEIYEEVQYGSDD
jgi:hypothetical protein